MAAEYEVNIKLNTKQIDAELKSIDKTTKNIGKGVKQTIDPSVKRLQAQGLALRRLAKSINPLLKQADRVAVSLAKQADITSKKFLPSSKDLNAAGRGIKRLTTEKEKQAKLDVRAEQGLARRARKIKEINRLEQEGNEARARFLAGAPIPGLRRGQVFGPGFPTSGPSMPIGAGRNQYRRPIGPAMAPMQGVAFPIAGTAGIPGSPEFNRALELGRFRSSPIGGATSIAGSPAARRVRRQRLEQVGLGAGFPLLFGGGPGAVLGGAAGGLTGSFGAQIAFSAIGQQIDRFIASVAAVGTALTSASGTVEMFREKNLFSSDAVKEHAFQLEEQGKMQELATLLTKDLASQIGKNAVESFQLLGGETKEFLKTINHLFLAVQGFVAGPLAKLLGAINTVLGGVSTDVQFGSLRGSLTGDAAAQFEAIVAEARGTRQLSSQERQRAISKGKPTDPEPGRLTTAVKEAVLKDPRVAKLRQTIDVTGQTTLDDTLGFKPPKDKAKAKAERQQLEAFLALNKQMTAELDRQDEINAMNGKYIAEQLNNADKINDSQEKRAGLLQAQINGTEDEFRLNQAIKEIKDKGLLPADENRLIAAEKQIHAMEKQAKQVERLEQLYQQVGSAIENALVDGIMAAIDGTKSLQSIVSSLLKDVGRMFLQFGIRTALNSVSPSVFPMAQGGFVSSPTRALVGESGNEYVIPEGKMRESMARYSRGARGAAVIPGSGDSEASGGSGGTAVAAPIDVRFSVERINNIDYVTSEEFQAGLQQAASQGAQRGQQLALTRLQQSPATRRRLGL